MQIVLIGTVESTAVTLRCLVNAGHPPVCVVGIDRSLSARHSDYVDMAELSARSNIRFLPVRSINAPDVVAQIRSLNPDWLLVVGWSQICGQELLSIPRSGAIGYHPSPLPELRGRAVLAWTILLEKRQTAGSLFYLEPSVDSGEIVGQRAISVDERETVASLMLKHMLALEMLWEDLIPRMVNQSIQSFPQDDSLVSYCAKRTEEDGLIDWTSSAKYVDRLIRSASHPYPGAFTTVGGAKLILWAAEVWDGPKHYGTPGQITRYSSDEILISCGGYSTLLVKEWSYLGQRQDDARVLKVGRRLGT